MFIRHIDSSKPRTNLTGMTFVIPSRQAYWFYRYPLYPVMSRLLILQTVSRLVFRLFSGSLSCICGHEFDPQQMLSFFDTSFLSDLKIRDLEKIQWWPVTWCLHVDWTSWTDRKWVIFGVLDCREKISDHNQFYSLVPPISSLELIF